MLKLIIRSLPFVLLIFVLDFYQTEAIPSNNLLNLHQTASAQHNWEGGIAPYAGAPKCPYHNERVWHGLWDSVRGCHYDHEHKDNPGVVYAGISPTERAQAIAIYDLFGPPGEWFGGHAISYPWQTFHGAGENYPPRPADPAKWEANSKHEGYGWIVRTNQPRQGVNWIKDYRLQYHAIFASVGAVTRYHSFSLEANVCHAQDGCRIIRTGGWLDFGHLRVSGKTIYLPHQVGDGRRQRLHRQEHNTQYTAYDTFRTTAVWYGMFTHPAQAQNAWDTSVGEHPFRQLTLSLESYDSWSNIDPNAPYSNNFFCPEFDCNKNGSTVKLHRLQIDFGEGGYSGFTDRYGLVVNDCQFPGLDCIPTEIEAGGSFHAATRDTGQATDYDVSPPDTWWINYPN